jgi:hypothetical protein
MSPYLLPQKSIVGPKHRLAHGRRTDQYIARADVLLVWEEDEIRGGEGIIDRLVRNVIILKPDCHCSLSAKPFDLTHKYVLLLCDDGSDVRQMKPSLEPPGE